ncbi:uncharacterized protein BXZ73DRAFT_34804, partial [Epithele typhae]|uniref:uncharacterized protein n=1 Tax=Epithele typhae TaxID=378194 RepID=UPI0020074553
EPVTAREALEAAVARSGNRVWASALTHVSPAPNAIRWGPHDPDATTATLFVDIVDDAHFHTLKAVHGTRLLFNNGPRACTHARLARTRPQCSNCQQFGHVAPRCRAPPKCGLCAGAHETRLHAMR